VSLESKLLIDIDALPMDERFILESSKKFDVIIGLDWLFKVHVNDDCYEKVVRIPLPNGEILLVQGEQVGEGGCRSFHRLKSKID
jgi:hypothetical protein